MTDVLISRSAPSEEELHEIVKMGKAIYAANELELEASTQGEFVSIDVDTEEYAVADSPTMAAKKLLQKNPDARLYGARIGHEAMYNL